MKRILIAISLLLIFLIQINARKDTPRFVRTVTYKAVEKDGKWTTGAVVDRIRFAKFNKKGFTVIDNLLNPDGSVHSKSVYLYGDKDRVKEEAVYTSARNMWRIFAYEYDDKDRIVRSTEMDLNRKERYIVTISYDPEERIVQRIVENLEDNHSITYDVRYGKAGEQSKVVITNSKGTQYINDLQKTDTTSLRSHSNLYGAKHMAKPQIENATFEYDTCDNWVKMTELKNGVPEVIIIRDIEYYGERTDWDEVPLLGKVKSMEQIAYVPIPTNSEVVYKGARLGYSYRYNFNENGRKISGEKYTDKVAPAGKTVWEYDSDDRITKELYYESDNALQSYVLWAYNRDGNVRSKVMYDAGNQITRTGVYRYDLEYNCVQEIWQTPHAEIYSNVRYEYNSYGQQVGVTPVSHVEGGEYLYSVKRKWNFRGRLLEEQVTMLPGVGRHLFTYKYNTKGEVISGTEKPDGKDVLDYNYKFSYDDQGNWKIRVKYVDDVPVAYEERNYVYYK